MRYSIMWMSRLAVFLQQSVRIVLLTLYLTGCEPECRASAQLSGKFLFDSAVESVKTIARELGNGFDTHCPPWTCPCSQDLCQPLPKTSSAVCFQIQSTSFNSNLYNCSNLLKQDGAPNCPSVNVTPDKSSVNYVRITADANPIVDISRLPLRTQQSAVCRTQQLDTVFVNVSASYRQHNIYADYYVGTIDGSFRNFPGREDSSKNCAAFDSRKRPWYSGAISYPNHLVILIDRGNNMDTDATLATTTSPAGTRLDYAKIFASALMETVYVGSYVNVFTFGGGSDVPYKTSTPVQFNSDYPQSHPELEALKIQINSTINNETSTVPLDVMKALDVSFRAFNGTNRDMYNRLPALNVILFTDGFFTRDINYSDAAIAAVISQFTTRNVTLFIYGMSSNPAVGDDAGLTTLAQKVGGFYRNIRDSDFRDPLFSMGSYFGFLAASHKNMYGDSPFWSRNYKDYFSIATIVTVAAPAFTASNSFVGVAAIDIILDELGPETGSNVRDDFTEALTNQRNSQDALPVSFTAEIPGTFDDSNSSCQYNSQLLCPPGVVDPVTPFYKRTCCDSCAASLGSNSPGPEIKGRSHSNNTNLGIILGPAIGAFVVAILAAAILIWLRRRRRAHIPPRAQGARSPDRQNQEDVWAKPM